jgi:uncharacterized protein (TIGR00730 family)
VAAICVFCASSRTLDRRWLELARELGDGLAAAGHSLVSGGGKVGMMGTVALGTRAAGGHTLGVIPAALAPLEMADTDADELITTNDMADRKTVMMAKADGFVILPGGLGTLDELFEVWTTASLNLHGKPVVLVNTGGFYTGLLDWLAGLVPPGFVRAEAMGRLIVVDSVPAAIAAVAAAGSAEPAN